MWIDPAFGTGVHVKLTDSGSRTDFVHLQPVVESFEILKIEHKISNTFFVILSTDLKVLILLLQLKHIIVFICRVYHVITNSYFP